MGLILSLVSLLLLASYFFWRWNTQPIVIMSSAQLPKNFPNKGFSHQSFAELLQRFVTKTGQVDYQRWYDDKPAVAQLDGYLAAVAKYSPENELQRFIHKNDRLAYWVYSYNGQVIKSILSNWPISSVTDLKAPVEIVQGLGFFYKRKFIFGGKAYSLYQVEHSKIFDGESDPRVHFILNCGSGSCPVLRPQLPLGDELEPFLKLSAQAFIQDSKNLRIDHSSRTIYLSTIFKWYKSDFIQSINSQYEQPTLLHYLQSISGETQLKDLQELESYQIKYFDYDWDLNQADKKLSDDLGET